LPTKGIGFLVIGRVLKVASKYLWCIGKNLWCQKKKGPIIVGKFIEHPPQTQRHVMALGGLMWETGYSESIPALH
jgi:hypothetical protein